MSLVKDHYRNSKKKEPVNDVRSTRGDKLEQEKNREISNESLETRRWSEVTPLILGRDRLLKKTRPPNLPRNAKIRTVHSRFMDRKINIEIATANWKLPTRFIDRFISKNTTNSLRDIHKTYLL